MNIFHIFSKKNFGSTIESTRFKGLNWQAYLKGAHLVVRLATCKWIFNNGGTNLIEVGVDHFFWIGEKFWFSIVSNCWLKRNQKESTPINEQKRTVPNEKSWQVPFVYTDKESGSTVPRGTDLNWVPHFETLMLIILTDYYHFHPILLYILKFHLIRSLLHR